MAAVKWQIVGHQETAMTSFPFPSTALRPWQLLYMYAESNGNQQAQAGGKIPVPRLHSPLHRFVVYSNMRLRGRLQLYAGFTAMASPSCE